MSRGDLLTPCFSLSRASHCWELLTAKARSLSLSGASCCWEAARCGEAHRCRELLTVGRSPWWEASHYWEASHCQELLTVGSVSLFGGVLLLGGNVSLSGVSQSSWVVRRHLTVRSFSLLGSSHCLEAFHSRYFCHTSRQCQNRCQPLIVVRFSLSGVSYGRDGQEVSLSRASRHRELLIVGRFQI